MGAGALRAQTVFRESITGKVILPGDAKVYGLKLRRSDDGKNFVRIAFDGATLDVGGTKVPLKSAEGTKALDLQVFLDGSVMEVYADGGRVAVTKVIRAGEKDTGVAVFAEGGSATLERCHSRKVGSIWDAK